MLADAVLESWDRQSGMIASIASTIDESSRGLKPSEDGWPIYEQLAHIHEARYGWLSKVSPSHAEALGEVYIQQDDQWIAIQDMDVIRRELALSAKAIRDAMVVALEEGRTQVGPYSHPVHFMQHMIWHEGYHYALIVLALRNAGVAPTEEWEEANVWGVWRS